MTTLSDHSESDELNILLVTRKYLNEWLEQNKYAQNMLPYFQHQLALTELNIKTLSNLSEDAEDFLQDPLLPSLIKENDQIKLINTNDLTTAGTSKSVTTKVSRVESKLSNIAHR